MEIMEIGNAEKHHWKAIRDIYREAFPKAERKPFFAVKRSVKKGKAQMLAAVEEGCLQGFILVIPYRDMAMIDYLAVSGRTRGRGTGGQILQEVCRRFAGKRLVLLIERPDDRADNREQRIARRRFYVKNGFVSSGIFINGYSGSMEILHRGGEVSSREYMERNGTPWGNGCSGFPESPWRTRPRPRR